MKKTKFTIWYSDGTGLEQYAFSMGEAVILSMAKRIANGVDHSIDSIENEKGQYYEMVDYMRFEKMVNV